MIKITIHSIGSGRCSLTEKDGEGLSVSFDDHTVVEAFLSWKAFRQLLAMKSAQGKTAAVKPPEAKPLAPAAVPAGIPAK